MQLATERRLDNCGFSLGNDRWRQFKSNSQGMLAHAGGQSQSPPLFCLWGSTTLHGIIHAGPHVWTHTHTNTSSQTSDLCICRVAKICETPTTSPNLQIFFVLSASFIFHQLPLQASLTDKSEQISPVCACLQFGVLIWVDWDQAAGLEGKIKKKKNGLKSCRPQKHRGFFVVVVVVLVFFTPPTSLWLRSRNKHVGWKWQSYGKFVASKKHDPN